MKPYQYTYLVSSGVVVLSILGSTFAFEKLGWWIGILFGAIVAVAACMMFRRFREIFVGILAVLLISGTSWGLMYREYHQLDQAIFTQTIVTARAERVEVKEKFTSVTLKTSEINEVSVKSRLLLSLYGEQTLSVGDTVTVRCNIERTEPGKSGEFDRYVATKKIFGSCNGAKILSREHSMNLRSGLEQFRQVLRTQIRTNVAMPVAGLLIGMMLGDESLIPAHIHDAFVSTGTSHILAISGFNIALFTVWGMRLWPYVRVRRQYAALLMLGIVACFVVMVGGGASVVRAAIMGCIPLLAPLLNRQSSAQHLLIIAATVMIVGNPYITLYDVGFQLSFAATGGILWWSPLIEHFLKRHADMLPHAIIAPSIAAFWSTIPIIIWQFQVFSPYSIILNIIIALAVTQLMAVILLLLIGGSLPLVGTAIMYGATILGLFIIACTIFTARLPFAILATGPPYNFLLITFWILITLSPTLRRIFRYRHNQLQVILEGEMWIVSVES